MSIYLGLYQSSYGKRCVLSTNKTTVARTIKTEHGFEGISEIEVEEIDDVLYIPVEGLFLEPPTQDDRVQEARRIEREALITRLRDDEYTEEEISILTLC